MTEKAQAYFIPEAGNPQWNGEEIFRDIVAQEREAASLSCDEAETQAATKGISGDSIVINTCASGCHIPMERGRPIGKKLLMVKRGKVSGASYWFFNDAMSDEHLKRVYIRSNSVRRGLMMPLQYSEVDGLPNSSLVQRQVFKCYIEKKAKDRNIELPELRSCATIDHIKQHKIIETPETVDNLDDIDAQCLLQRGRDCPD